MFAVQIPVNAPETARGELEITYVDEELRSVVNAILFSFYAFFFVKKQILNVSVVCDAGCQGVTRAICLY